MFRPLQGHRRGIQQSRQVQPTLSKMCAYSQNCLNIHAYILHNLQHFYKLRTVCFSLTMILQQSKHVERLLLTNIIFCAVCWIKQCIINPVNRIWIIYIQMFMRPCIQGVSRLQGITAGGDFLGFCDQKSSYKHVSDFGRLRSQDRLKLRTEGNDY